MQLLALESTTMQECIKAEAHQTLLSNRLNRVDENPKLPVFLLRVRRQHVLEDTFQKLSRVEDICLKMQLLIQFEGEADRYEARGILIEFFLSVFDKMIHPDYGMFMYCEKNSPVWFPARPSAEMKKYYFFGVLLGMCVFNRVVASVPFPLVVFKKLMDKKPSLDDLKELSPVLGKSLQAVLDYEEGDMEAELQLCYNISWDNMDVDLIPNGRSVAVNKSNKKDFVSTYIDYIFNKSVEGVFEEFKRGFYKVLDKRVIGFFEPQELMAVAVGDTNYDWDAYEKNTIYWGIDRVPVVGMELVKLTIHSHKALSEDHLPEAQSCIGLLLLPPYSTIGRLKEKLLQAIENNRGFGKQ